MSGFPIGNQIKPNIQLQLFDRINSVNRTDSDRNPLSTISKEIESNPYSQMLTKSCWVKVTAALPQYKKDKEKLGDKKAESNFYDNIKKQKKVGFQMQKLLGKTND